MFGFLSVDKKGSRPVNYGSTFRAAVNIKEVGKIRWPNNKLDLWFFKALNIESTERNSVRFFSNISKTRPYCIFLIDNPLRYKSDLNHLINLTPSDPFSGRGMAINSICGTSDLCFLSMIKHISPLRRPVKTVP